MAECVDATGDDVLRAAAGNCGTLEELDASAAPAPPGWRRDAGVGGGVDRGLASNVPWYASRPAATLPVSDARGPTDAGLAALSASMAATSLRILKLRGGTLTDGGLDALARACPDLEDLDVSRCDRLHESGLRALVATSAAGLRALTARACEHVSDRATFMLFHTLEARGGDLFLAVARACRYRPMSRLAAAAGARDDGDVDSDSRSERRDARRPRADPPDSDSDDLE